jgi:putative tryptophan/tyrosine transport system substrate-binding protein
MMKRFLIMAMVTVFSIHFFASGCEKKPDLFNIGVLQWTEKVEPFNFTFRGVVDGLNDRGYRKGVNLNMIFRNAEQDKDTALKIAQEFVEKDVDLIVALGTGSSLAALKATENNKIPIVFSIVGAPKATGIIDSYADSGRNITGVSMKVPVEEQFRVVGECLLELKKLGVLYCTKMPQAVATGKEGLTAAAKYGWTPIDIPIESQALPGLETILEPMATKVNAIYIPTDPILGAPDNLKKIITVFDKHAIPVICVAERFVEQGALMALSCDFYEIGRQAAEQIEQVIAGVSVRNISVQKPTINKLSLNLRKAKKLGIEIKRNCILRADKLFE